MISIITIFHNQNICKIEIIVPVLGYSRFDNKIFNLLVDILIRRTIRTFKLFPEFLVLSQEKQMRLLRVIFAEYPLLFRKQYISKN